MAEGGQYESCPRKSGQKSPYQIILKHGIPEYLELKLAEIEEDAGDYLEPISSARAQEDDTGDYLHPLCSKTSQEDSGDYLHPSCNTADQEDSDDYLCPTSQDDTDDYLQPTSQEDTDDYGEKINQEDTTDYLHPPGSTMHQFTPENRSLTPLPPLPEEAAAANYDEIELEDFYEEVPDIRGEQSNSTVMNNSQDGKAKSKGKRNRVLMIVGVTIGMIALLSSVVLLMYFLAPRHTDIDECEGEPCENGGTCIDRKDYYTCDCAPGYTGPECQTEINECEPNPCENGGSCDDVVNGYECDCADGYTGENCKTEINECGTENLCQNEGTCIDQVNGYKCECVEPYFGTHCELTEPDSAKKTPSGVKQYEGYRVKWRKTGYEGLRSMAMMRDGSCLVVSATGVTRLPAGGVTTSSYTLQRFSPEGEPIDLPFPIFATWPTVIGINQSSTTVVVVDYRGKSGGDQVSVYSKQGDTWQYSSFSTRRNIQTVAITDDGCIVCTALSDDLKQTLVLMSGTGQEEWTRSLPEGKYMTHICVSNQMIIVSSVNNDTVTVINRHGDLVHTLPSGLISQPSGVTSDSTGHLVIADMANKSISLFTPEGHFIKTLVKCQGIPVYIGLSQDRFLLVNEYIDGKDDLCLYELH